MKLHTKILLGLVLGAAAGITANAVAHDAAWVRWIGDYVAGPVGQVFLRFLLMTVVPLVFASLTLCSALSACPRRASPSSSASTAFWTCPGRC